MAKEITMPQLSDTMHDGKILSWNVKEGDTVDRGDILAEVETDKANLEIEAFHPGTVLKIVVSPGESAKVGEIIAYIGEAGEEVDAAAGSSGEEQSSAEQQQPEHESKSDAPSSASEEGHEERNEAKQVESEHTSERIKASPLAKKIAAQHDIDLSRVQGSGPEGRIVRKDVERASGAIQQAEHVGGVGDRGFGDREGSADIEPRRASAMQKGDVGSDRSTERSGGTLSSLTKMRQTIARRMVESVQTTPHFFVKATIAMDEAVALRALLKESEKFKGISLNHLVIKASAYALARAPRANCAYRDGELFTPHGIHIGIITALDDGLMIPVLHDVDRMPLHDVVYESRALIDRVRTGRPSSADLTGATFSISNLGMFGVDEFTAIINPGQGAALAVGAVVEQPVMRNGALQMRKMMSATVSSDHRIIDGVAAASFLQALREGLEHPALLME